MADATPATNATNHTRYFNLPLFISTDRPSWLVDWNGAMGEIDTILNDIATTSEGASSAVATIQTQINTLSATVTSLNGIVDTAVADVASMQTTVDAVETRLDNVESDLITQNNLIKTLSDTVVSMQATVSTLNNHVTTLNDAVTAMGTNVSAIQTALNGLSSDVATIQSNITSLDNRVTALENTDISGVPSITDLLDTSKFTKRVDTVKVQAGVTPYSLTTVTNDDFVIFEAILTCPAGTSGGRLLGAYVVDRNQGNFLPYDPATYFNIFSGEIEGSSDKIVKNMLPPMKLGSNTWYCMANGALADYVTFNAHVFTPVA